MFDKEVAEKKIILGTSDACSMSPLSQRPIKLAYYIEDWRIYFRPSRQKLLNENMKKNLVVPENESFFTKNFDDRK